MYFSAVHLSLAHTEIQRETKLPICHFGLVMTLNVYLSQLQTHEILIDTLNENLVLI